MKLKRLLSAALAASMTLTELLTDVPSAAAYQPVGENANASSSSVSAKGTNSFGAMVAEDIEEQISQGVVQEYSVDKVVIDDNYMATITTTAQTDCKIIVGIYDDSGEKMLTYAETRAEAGINEVTVQLDGSAVPEFYVVRAYAVSLYTGQTISVEYKDESHTKKWYDFDLKTINDFDYDLIYNFDNDPNDNFVVYRREVKRTAQGDNSNIPVLLNYVEDIYTFSDADDVITSLQKGDLFSYVTKNESMVLIEVDTVENNGTTVTVKGIRKEIEDFFSFVKISLDGEDFVNSVVQTGEVHSESAAAPQSEYIVMSVDNEDAVRTAQPEYGNNITADDVQTTETICFYSAEALSASGDIYKQYTMSNIELHTKVSLEQEGASWLGNAEYDVSAGGYFVLGDARFPFIGVGNDDSGEPFFVTDTPFLSENDFNVKIADDEFSVSVDDKLEAEWTGENFSLEYEDDNGNKFELDTEALDNYINNKKNDDEGGLETSFSFAASADIVIRNINLTYRSSDETGQNLVFDYDYSVDAKLNAEAGFEYDKDIPVGSVPLFVPWLTLSLDFVIELEGKIEATYEYSCISGFTAVFDSNNILPQFSYDTPVVKEDEAFEGNLSIKVKVAPSINIFEGLVSVGISVGVQFEVKSELHQGSTSSHLCDSCTTGQMYIRALAGYKLGALFGLLKWSGEYTMAEIKIADFYICHECKTGLHDGTFGTLQWGVCPCIAGADLVITPYSQMEDGSCKYYSVSDNEATIVIYNVGPNGELTPIENVMTTGFVWSTGNGFMIDCTPGVLYAAEVYAGDYNSKELLYFQLNENKKSISMKLGSDEYIENNYKVISNGWGVDHNEFYIKLPLLPGTTQNYKVESTDGMPIVGGNATITYIPGCKNEDDFSRAGGNSEIKTITAEVDKNGRFSVTLPVADRDTLYWQVAYEGEFSYGIYSSSNYYSASDKDSSGEYIIKADCANSPASIQFVDDRGNPLAGYKLKLTLSAEADQPNLFYSDDRILLPEYSLQRTYTLDDEGKLYVTVPYRSYTISCDFESKDGVEYYVDTTVAKEFRDDNISFNNDNNPYISISKNDYVKEICATTAKRNVEVRVVNQRGEPVEGATVSSDLLCCEDVVTDAEGKAVIRLTDGPVNLTAAKDDIEGYRHIIIEGDIYSGENAVEINIDENLKYEVDVLVTNEKGDPLPNATIIGAFSEAYALTNEQGIAELDLFAGEYTFAAKKGNNVSESVDFTISVDSAKEDFNIHLTLVSQGENDDFVKVFAADTNIAGITSDGSLYIWGDNSYGKLGIGTKSGDISTPVYVNLGGKKADKVVWAPNNVAVITEDGSLFIWGDNNYAQLGTGDNADVYTPIQADINGKKVKDVYLCSIASGFGTSYKCAQIMVLTTDGELYASGYDADSATFGKGTIISEFTKVNIPEKVETYQFNIINAFSNTVSHAALTQDGKVYIWGSGSLGTTPTLVDFDGKAVKEVKLCTGTFIAITEDNCLYMWGSNSYGQVGNGTDKFVSAPVLILENVNKANCFNNTSAALTFDNKVYVWGKTSDGQAMNGADETLSPCEISGENVTFSSDDAQLIVGSCVIVKSDLGNVYIWGATGWGDLSEAVQVYSDIDYIGGSLRGENGVLYAVDDGKIYSMGDNTYGQCGVGGYGYVSPTLVSELNGDIVEVGHVNNGSTMYALTEKNSIYVWGLNGTALSANSGGIEHCYPAIVDLTKSKYIDVTVLDANGLPVSEAVVSVGSIIKMPTDDNGTIRLSLPDGNYTLNAEFSGYTVSKNITVTEDALGNNGITLTLGCDSQAINNAPDVKFKQIVTYGTKTYLLAQDGTIYYKSDDNDPVLLDIGEPIAFIADMYSTKTIAITESGKYCEINKGEINYGDLGTEKVEYVYIGSGNYAAISESGKLYMWGDNTKGIIDPESSGLTYPVHISTITEKVTDIVVSGSSTSVFAAAVTEDGKLYTWGGTKAKLGREYDDATCVIPTLVDISNVKKVVTNSTAGVAAAITTDGKLYMWGKGNAITKSPLGAESDVPQIVPLEVKVKDCCIVDSVCFIITEDGDLYVWGNNGSKYVLGIGSTLATQMAQIAIDEPIVKISGSNNAVMALTESGALYVWGLDSNGQLGTNGNVDTPVLLDIDGKTVKDMITQSASSAALMTDGSVYVWGNDMYYSPKGIKIADLSGITATVEIMLMSAAANNAETRVTKTFTDLDAGARYNFYAKDSNGSLVYVAQYIADENGTITADFVSEYSELEYSVSKLVTMNIAYADIITHDKQYNGEALYCDIDVTLNGEPLTLANDYYMAGDVIVEESGVYEPLVVGTGEYFGYAKIIWNVYSSEKEVKSISISTMPYKTTYGINERLDLSGTVISVTYLDGTVEKLNVTESMVSGFASSSSGTKTITVTYGGKTCTFNVVVRKASSGGTGGTSGGSLGNYAEKIYPALNDVSMTWSVMSDEIAKLAEGTDAKITLNGNYDVPADVIKAIADKAIKVSFVVSSSISWQVDGADIKTPAAADLRVLTTVTLDTSELRGTAGIKFRLDGTNIPAKLTVSVSGNYTGKFANLYKMDGDKPVFVDNAKVDENGKVILPANSTQWAAGDYIIMLCEYSDRNGDVTNDGIVNVFDASAILKDIVNLEAAPNPVMADYNGDGRENVFDASALLIDIVNSVI